MSKSVLLLLAVVSAILLSASFPPFNLSVLAWCALSPFLFALRQRGTPSAGGLGFLFGCLFGIGAFYWFDNVVSLANFLIFLVFFGLYYLFFGLLYRLVSTRIGSWIILGAPALWVSLEYTRSNLFFLAWPWNLLAHSQYRHVPLIQIADLTGEYGISFLIVMVNQLLSQVPDLLAVRKVPVCNGLHRSYSGNTWTGHLLTVAVVLVSVFSYGWHSLQAPKRDAHLRVALVQANVLTRDDMPLAEQREHLQVYEQLTKEVNLKEPDLIVWPASSLPAPISASRLVRRTVSGLARETGSYLLVGGAGYEKNKPRKEGYLPYSNSEFLISPSGRVMGQYNKIRLLPFNEYLPLKGKITWPKWITTVTESFLPGEEYTLFEVSGARFGTPICWENMFPAFFRRFVKDGADFMVSVTNEGFFGPTGAPYQTLAINVFRAVENRVAVVRAAPTGVSAFINPDGEIVERVKEGNGKDLFVSGFLVRDVSLSSKKTFYTVYGDVFAYGIISMAALTVLVAVCPRKWIQALRRA